MKDIATKEKNCLTTREVPAGRILKKGENMQIHDAAMQVLIGLFVIVLLINIFYYLFRNENDERKLSIS
jgi:hypothetical protein